MTLVCKFDLDIVKTYLHNNGEGSRSRLTKIRPRTGQAHRHRQTDRQMRQNALHRCIVVVTNHTISHTASVLY